METPQDVRHAIRPRDWAASINLKDAYPHPYSRQEYLRFGWSGHLYQFCVLPFGLSPGGFHDQVFAHLWASPWGGGVFHPHDVTGFSPFFFFSFVLILESTL
jgi:hypothetical protein